MRLLSHIPTSNSFAFGRSMIAPTDKRNFSTSCFDGIKRLLSLIFQLKLLSWRNQGWWPLPPSGRFQSRHLRWGYSSSLPSEILSLIPRWHHAAVIPSSNTKLLSWRNQGWWPLISFGSTVPSVGESYKKQMFALGKTRRTNFPFRKTNAGSTMLALPARVP